MKKFLRKILMFVPIIFVIIVVNVIVDPAHIYKKSYEEEAAKLLLSGQNVVGMTNYDERIFQEEFIRNEPICPDTILLGSSRIMTLTDEAMKNMGGYRNHGISGAGIFDYLGILGIYESCNKLPMKVVLGLDPWILNENNGETRYQSIVKYINDFGEILPDFTKLEANALSEKRMQFISVPYFQSSVEFLLKNPDRIWDLYDNIGFYGTKERLVDETIRYIDGSIEYQLEEREKSVEQANKCAKDYVKGGIYQSEGYNSLSEKYCVLLEKLVEYLQEEGREVLFYLPPYHPYVYQYLVNNVKYKNIFEAEKFFISLSEKRNIDVYGAYNPKETECTERDFLDGMHLKRTSMKKAWRKSQ